MATLRRYLVRRISSVTILAIFVGIAPTLLAQNTPSADKQVREITMTAKKYEFSPSEIRVHAGETVRLVITALDREHGIKIEAFEIDRELPKGEAVSIEFTAKQAGTFPFKCSKYCGLRHGRMKGELIVE